jgi:hypothetical protein
MATRFERLEQFVTDSDPPARASVELLCEDHRGTYVLPFACVRTESDWHNAGTGERIEATVLGWREPARDGLHDAGNRSHKGTR